MAKSLVEEMLEMDAAPLVNESDTPIQQQASSDSLLSEMMDMDKEAQGVITGAELRKQKIEKEYKAKLPTTWFGEMTHGLSRSTDQMQQAGYAVGSILSDTVGLDKLAGWFNEGILQQNKEIADAPSGATSYKDVEGFDSAMRYLFSTGGELAPDIGSAVISGGVGAFLGKRGLQKFVERQAVAEALKGVKDKQIKNELLGFARGQIEKEGLQDATKGILQNEVSRLAGKYGALGAMATSSIGQETGSIYSDLKQDPNLAESDRKTAALIGGLVAGTADFAVEGWIASKFFKGKPNVTREETDQATGFLKRYVEAYGKEFVKAMPSESGTELFQTVVEEAAKNWADPAKRDAIFTFSPEQKESFIDATIKGGLGGSIMSGASALAVMPRHPNLKVREFEDKVTSRANDLSVDAFETTETDTDKRLSAIGNRRIQLNEQRQKILEQAGEGGSVANNEGMKAIDAELAALDIEEQELLGDEEESLVNEKEEETPAPAPKVEAKVSDLEAEVASIRKTFSENPPDREIGAREETIDHAAVELKRKEIDEAGGEGINSLFDDKTINLFAKEGVMVRQATNKERTGRLAGEDTFGVVDDAGEGISLLIPTKKTLDSLAKEGKNVQEILNHETVHVADLVQIRNEAKALNKNFNQYEAEVMARRGQALMEASPYLPKEVSAVYGKDLNARQLGQEFTRMMIEYARSGRINEVTDAIARAQKEAKGNSKGLVSNFLKEWMKAIKGIRDSIVRMLDPKTAPAEIVRAVDNINKVLDKYGVLVNEKDQPAPSTTPSKKEPEQTTEKKPEPKESKTPERKKEKPRKQLKEYEIDAAEKLARREGKIDTIMLDKRLGIGFSRGLQMLEALAERGVIKSEPAGGYSVVPEKEATPLVNEKEAAKANVVTDPSSVVSFFMDRSGKVIGSIDQYAHAGIASNIVGFVDDREGAMAKRGWSRGVVDRQGRKIFINPSGPITPSMRRVLESMALARNLPIINEKNNQVIVDFSKEAAGANLENATEKREIAQREGFKYDGVMMETIDLYTDYRQGNSFGATAAIRIPYTEIELLTKFQEFRAKFTTPLDDKEGATANIRNSGSNKVRQYLKLGLQNANRISNSVFMNIDVKESERRKVAGEVEYEDATPLDLEYMTRPHSESAYEAQVLVNEKGDALNVALSLERDMLGKELGLGDFGPDSKLAAVYENVIRQLVSTAVYMRKRGGGRSTPYGEIRRLAMVLEENYRRMNNAGGSMSAYTGKSNTIFTGESARKEMLETLMPHAEKIIGKDAKEKFQKIVTDLNALWQKYATNVTNSPKVIAAVRKLHKLVDAKKFAKGVRQTVIKDLQTLEGIVGKAAARAAEFISGQNDSEAMINKVTNYVVNEMKIGDREPNAPDELDLVHSVLRSIGIQEAQTQQRQGKFFHLAFEAERKQTKADLKDKFAALLKNEFLYQEFATKLRDRYIKEFGGVNPSEAFLEQANAMYNRVAMKMWRPNMVTALVNETLRQNQIDIAKIVKDHYEAGTFAIEKIRDSIAQYMDDQGVTDQVLIDQLAQDVENEMLSVIEEARNDFFGARGTIREFLKNLQTNLSEAAKQHSSYVEGMEREFERVLIETYRFPNTKEMPIASTLAKAMQAEFNEMVYGERVKIVNNWQKTVLPKSATDLERTKMDRAVERILQMVNVGAIRQEDVYRALQEKFNLPEYSEETARVIYELGEHIGNAGAPRTKDILKQRLADFITARRGLKTSDIYTSWMYFSMLSGPSTSMVNIAGNLTSMMGYIFLEGVKHPRRLGMMLRAMIRTAMGTGLMEAKYVLLTGMSLGKQGEKYFSRTNPLEQPDAYIKESIFGEGKAAEYDRAFAAFTQKAARGMKGQYVGRFLAATDIFFYKMAQEAAYTARVGEVAITPDMWSTAMAQARGDLLLEGIDPDLQPEHRKQQELIAHSLINDVNFSKSRFRDSNGALVNERVMAWQEANSEALETTFTQEPRGILGYVARGVEQISEHVPILKLLVPFTRVAANVTNQMLDWTPYGAARWAFGSVYGDDFRVPLQGGYTSLDSFNKLKDDMKKRDANVGLRALFGTAAMLVLIASVDDEDEGREPYFTIYGDGPRDIELRRQLQQRGWKPNTIKIGKSYWSYLYTPLAMAFSIVGKRLDNARDGKINENGLATYGVALMDAVKNQSFLAGITDLFSALDSPNPESKVARIFGRTASIVVPNFFKQIDRTADLSVQEAQGFAETWIREFPMARHLLKPALNIFGEPVERTTGLIRFPGLERFMTLEKTDDPVLNMISERGLKVPGISKSTHLGEARMDPEVYYEYVQIVGPKVYARYRSELSIINSLSREAAQDRMEQISTEEKKAAREILKKKYGISR